MNFNKKFWTMTLSAAMAASLLAGCGTSGSSADASASGSQGSNPGGEDGVFTIAYAPNESTTESADARNGLAKDLGEPCAPAAPIWPTWAPRPWPWVWSAPIWNPS